MKISSVETTTVTQRAKPALKVRGARTTHAESEFTLVRVVTDEGVEGYGEVSATAAWSGEDAATATHYIRSLIGPLLRGRELVPVAALCADIDRVLAGNWFTKAGVNMALWDALGKTLSLPVAVLLGGPFRDEVEVKISLSGNGRELQSAYEAARELGFQSFKVKVGRDPVQDAERLRAVRELAGPEAIVGVDANGGWTREAARRAIRMMGSATPSFVEQPVPAADLSGMADLRAFGMPVLADEAVYSEADVVKVAAAGAADVVNIYVGKSGGLDRAVHAARLAIVNGLEVVIGSNGEMGLGAAAQIQVACSCPRLSWVPSGIIGQLFYDGSSVVEQELLHDGRTARLPLGPGLGVEPTSEVRRRFSV